MGNGINSKQIGKNTLLLYFRMFVVILVGLYTSRVVLNTLGVSDFGLYNLVGGIVSMASFFNTAMVAATQRFLAYEIGRSDEDRLSKVFCTSINIQVIIIILVIIIAETLGLWFVNSKLNIPPDRIVAANWVFQASIVSFAINVLSLPYNSAIVAHEKMSAFAYISILDVGLKLLIVFLLPLFAFDRLIFYSILIVCVTLIIRLCYTIYCKRHFSECSYQLIIDKNLTKEMFAFSGWTMVGSLGFSFKDQISNIILNLFFGTTLNAARSIGSQVSAHVKTFAMNFTMALNPQITKQYAAGNIEASKKMVYFGSRLSFCLLSVVAIPVILNVDYILQLWLGIVPEYTSQFVIFSIIVALIYTLSECVTKAIQATGHVKWFQIGVSLIVLSELPIAWLFLKMGYPPYSVMWPSVLTYLIALVFRIWLIHRYLPEYNIKEYMSQVVLRSIIVFVVSYGICSWFQTTLSNTLWHLVLSVLFCVVTVLAISLAFGVTSNERELLFGYISKYVNIFKKSK